MHDSRHLVTGRGGQSVGRCLDTAKMHFVKALFRFPAAACILPAVQRKRDNSTCLHGVGALEEE